MLALLVPGVGMGASDPGAPPPVEDNYRGFIANMGRMMRVTALVAVFAGVAGENRAVSSDRAVAVPEAAEPESASKRLRIALMVHVEHGTKS